VAVDRSSTRISGPQNRPPDRTQKKFEYDGERLPAKYGFPMKLRMSTKLGYKNPKHIVEIFATSTYPGGYWVGQRYNWFGGA